MRYRNNKEPKMSDSVLGVTKSGQPIAGNVIQLNQETGKVQISPAVQAGTWVPVADCLPVGDAFKAFPQGGQQDQGEQKASPQKQETGAGTE